MKRLFIALTFLSLLLPAYAGQADKAQMKDSLLRIYLASSDTTRMETLQKIGMLDPQTPTFLYYQNKLLKEATAKKNIRYQSLAIYNHVIYHYNRMDEKHTKQWVYTLEKFAQKNNYYTDYFKGRKMLIEIYAINQKIELSINEALDMYKKAQKLDDRNGMREAYMCLTSNYIETMRYEEGTMALEKALKLTLPSDSPLERINIYSKAVLVYVNLGDNRKLFSNLQKMEKATHEFFVQHHLINNAYPELYLFIEMYYAHYYTRIRQSKQAWEHLQKGEVYMKASAFVPYKTSFLVISAKYYRSVKEYEKALSYWDAAIREIKPVSFSDAVSHSIQKADLLVEMGQAEKALPLYKQIIATKDSLNNNLATSQMEEIQSTYNMDQLMLQKEKRRSIFHYICLSVSVVTIIILLLFNIHIYRSRKRLQKDEQEMKRLTAIAEEANEVKSRFLANMSYNIRIPLNNVVGFSQLMTEDEKLNEEEKREYSGIIQHNSTELIQLVNDVLDLSRLEANMMKFQLQDCHVQEWCSDLGCMTQMRSEGVIQLQLLAEAGDAVIHTDTARLTQIVSGMLLYPTDCKDPRIVKMSLSYHPEIRKITCRIENSPLADPAFASQKVSVRQQINRLFFEHFNGTYQIEEENNSAITFTYPTLTV